MDRFGLKLHENDWMEPNRHEKGQDQVLRLTSTVEVPFPLNPINFINKELNMKRILASCLCGVFVVSLCGCGDSSNGPAKLPNEKEFKKIEQPTKKTFDPEKK